MMTDHPGLHGAYLRADLISSHGRRRVAASIACGELRPLWRAVVIDSRRFLDPWTHAAAAQLSAGPTAALCGTTVATLHGCRAVSSAVTHVAMPYEHRVRSRDGLRVHNFGFFASDVEDLEGLRVLPLDRVVADLLCTLSARDGLAVTDEALRLAGDEHELFRKRVAERLRTRIDPRGTVTGAVLLDFASPRAESPPESWSRLVIVERGFPLPEVNWPILAPDGREVFRLDLAWPEMRIAVEYDGYVAHEGRAAFDAAREEDLRRRGWIVVRMRIEDLADLSRVERELRAAFARRGYRW